jgi:class 3 adenylate cyclase/tetratricopeptide (TPR) repeat protein
MKDADQTAGQESSIEAFLRKRTELEQTIRDRFQREITVMFTDIASSTEFYEVYGDIEGRSMIQRHNDLLVPIIQKHGGRVLRALGDGLMAAFENPPDAARAGAEIQRTLAARNQGKSPWEQIWIKVAIHHGMGIVETGDVYGDMINTLARICALTRKGDIQVSQAYVDLVKDQHDIHYDYVGVKHLKGKAAPVEVYRIIWDPDQKVDLKRSQETEQDAPDIPKKTLRLHFSLQGELLRLALFPGGQDAGIFKQVQEFPYPEPEIRNLVEELEHCLATADGRGRLPKEKFLRVKELGRTLYGMLLPADIASFIAEMQPPDLILQIDAGLSFIPWELLYDGKEFLCVKTNMGRMVSTPQQPFAGSKDLGRGPLRILLVADPRGDLPASKVEGIALQRELNRSGKTTGLTVDLRCGEITSEFFQSHLSDYQMLHYAGHFDYVQDDPSQSGLLFADGKFEVGRLLSLAREAPLPALIFTNACQSGRTESWSSGERLYGLANAFLLSGVRHYIGGSIDLFDRSSAVFAEEFYRQLVKNQSVGEALRQARIKSIRRYGEENLTWASYVLYGDPSFRYFQAGARPADERMKPGPGSYRRIVLPLTALLLVVLAVFIFSRIRNAGTEATLQANEGFKLIHVGQLAGAEQAFSRLSAQTPLYHQGMSAVFLNRGNLAKAEENLSLAQREQPGAPYLGVIKAQLARSQGKLDEAAEGYRKGLESQKLEGWQQAECHFGLGRIYLARGETERAAKAFDETLKLDPSFLQAYTAGGLVLERLGKPSEALELYRQAADINIQDPISAALYRRSKEQLNYRESSARQNRIDELISDLLRRYREAPPVTEPQDEWSSRPLHLVFVDLETKGQSALREGEDTYINELLSRDLNNAVRFHTVERGLLERLLEELKLSSSKLADPQSALRLGKILSARILTTGTVLRYKGQVEVTLRAIDTENTRVAATVTATWPFGEDPAMILQALTQELQGRIASAYPIRGRVMEVEGGEMSLNVGSAMGVTPGMKFRVLENGWKNKEVTVREVGEMTAKAVAADDQVSAREGWRVEEM